MYRIGVDVGGTFTDFVLLDTATGGVRYWKVPSTPADPSTAIGDGIVGMLAAFGVPAAAVEFVGHGTTVATNMILERRGSATGLITTKGFRDVLAIGRQTRPALYDYGVRKPYPLVERYRRLEVDERLDAGGGEVAALPVDAVERAAGQLLDSGVEAIAICFLHAYRNPAHERAARDAVLRAFPAAKVTISSDVLPEFREYERTSTTVLNAYVLPKMTGYLARLRARVAGAGVASELLTIHSNGGLISLDTAERLPVLTCLSGPAAGVVGAAALGGLLGMPDIVTFDVGGTSTDVSLIADGLAQFTSAREIGQFPLKMPMIDIHVIGAGGGSIATVDDAGALKVGPQSAGAVPGPAAYGKGGTAPTLTDANIVLQRLNPVSLLEGQMPVDRDRAHAAIEAGVARPLGLSVEAAAYGMLRIAGANMSRAIRSVSVEHGHDLRGFVLAAFGGAGPLHAAAVAAECGIPRVLVPPEPGTMCARGILMSDISLDFVRTELIAVSAQSWPGLCQRIGAMLAEGDGWLARERVEPGRRQFEVTVEARYHGQTHEIAVSVAAAKAEAMAPFLEAFRQAHVRSYGYAIPGRAIEVVNARVRARGGVPKASLSRLPPGGVLRDAQVDERKVFFGPQDLYPHGWLPTPIYRRPAIPPGAAIAGPAILEEMSATTVVPPGQVARADEYGTIVIGALP